MYAKCKQNQAQTVEITFEYIKVISDSKIPRDRIGEFKHIVEQKPFEFSKFEKRWALFCIIKNSKYVDVSFAATTIERSLIVDRLSNLFWDGSVQTNRQRAARQYLNRNIKNKTIEWIQQQIKRQHDYEYNPFNDARYDLGMHLEPIYNKHMFM